MLIRTVLAVVLLLVGNSFVVYNGQVFSQALLRIGIDLAVIVLCFLNLRDRASLKTHWRIVTCALLFTSFAAGVFEGIRLPSNYRFQKEFNARKDLFRG